MMRLSIFAIWFFSVVLLRSSTADCQLRVSDDTTWTECQFPQGFGVTGFGICGHNLLAGAATVPYPLPYAYIFLSTDSGSTWTLQTSFFVKNWIDLDSGHIVSQIRFTPSVTFFDNGATLFAGISQVPRGAIYRSTDNGITWSDSGITWPEKDSDLAENINCFCGNGGKIFAGTGRGVFVTTDNGMSWNTSNTGLPNGQYDSAGVLHPPSVSSIVAQGSDLFASTSDDGATWTAVDSGLTNINVSDLATLGTRLFAGAFQWADDSTGGVFVSLDNGQSWSLADTGLTDHRLNTLRSDGSCLFAGTNGSIFASTDTGATWRNISIGTPVWAGALALYGSYLFASGYAGEVWRYPLTQLLNVVKNRPGQIPSEYVLNQNYPNPFNPSTLIKYQLPKDSRVTIKVYDILGREVATLVDGVESAGYHEVTFDGSRLASGVYFYRLTTPGYTEVMKMLLVK